MVTMYSGNGSPLIADKQGRNDLCACKSGKKVKKCCGNETRWRHSKVTEVRVSKQEGLSTEEEVTNE